jgi:hypothetical protein
MSYKADAGKVAFSYMLEEGRALSSGTLVMTEAANA